MLKYYALCKQGFVLQSCPNIHVKQHPSCTQKCVWNNTVYYTVQQIILRTPKLFVTDPTLRTARIEYIFMTLFVCRPTCVFSVCMHDSCLLLCVGVCYGCIKSHLLLQYVSFLVLGLVRGSLCLQGWYYSVLLEFSV